MPRAARWYAMLVPVTPPPMMTTSALSAMPGSLTCLAGGDHLGYRADMTAALDGLVALDLATFVAAPFCCTLLGEFGAEVIKVEQPGAGDDLRRLGHKAADGAS